MKKVVIRVTVLLIAFTFFTACSREEFMDLYGFTDRFTYTEISPDDFYADETDDGKIADLLSELSDGYGELSANFDDISLKNENI